VFRPPHSTAFSRTFDSSHYTPLSYYKLKLVHANKDTQCHTHSKVKDGPKRRRETQAGRVRAVSSASATSSSYPVKQELSQKDVSSHRHSTPTPGPGSSSLQSFGMSNGPTSTPTSNPQINTSCYQGNSAYPTPTSATPTMHSQRTPTASSFGEILFGQNSSCEPVVGMFHTPLQNLSSFSGAHPHSSSLSHQVSEPELVGIRTTTTALNSIASMM
jgi:hypothetical protein